MAEWKIETARRPSRCLACWHEIEAGDYRFGTPAKTRWFHLACAAEGAPVAFPPFAAQAAALLAKRPGPRTPAVSKARLAPLTASQLAGSLEVLADLLQEHGDPWGELIALRLHGDEAQAIDHLHRHRESLYGALQLAEVQWRDGVIASASFIGSTEVLATKLDRLAEVRTAGRLTELRLQGAFTGALLEKVSRTVGPTLERLSLLGHPTGLEALACPRLASLRLGVPARESLRAGPAPVLEGLFEARLPALRALRLTTYRPVAPAFLEALLGSTLLPRLTQLDFDDESVLARTLDDAGLRRLLAAKEALKHLKAMWVERAGRRLAPEELAAADAFFEARSRRALKQRQAEDEEPFDEV